MSLGANGGLSFFSMVGGFYQGDTFLEPSGSVGSNQSVGPAFCATVGGITAHVYTFTIESVLINKTRSSHEDTDAISSALMIGSEHEQVQYKYMGDVNDGLHPIALSFGPVRILSNEPVIFNYLIINKSDAGTASNRDNQIKAAKTVGKEGIKAIINNSGRVIGAILGGVADAALPVIGTILGAVAGAALDKFVGFLFANCDGTVAAEQFATTGAELESKTGIQGIFTQKTLHMGIESPAGCGGNSVYEVTWKVEMNA